MHRTKVILKTIILMVIFVSTAFGDIKITDFRPYLTFEKNIYESQKEYKLEYHGLTKLEHTDMASLGLTYQKFIIKPTIALGTPFLEKDIGLDSHLWLDANIAYDMGYLTIYTGLVRQLGDQQKDIVTQPMYIGLSSSLPLSKINIISDIQFAAGKFTDLYKEPSYRSLTFSVKAEYDYHLIHPNLNISLSKLFLESDPGIINDFEDNLSFNIAAGFTFGASSTTRCSQVIRSKGQVLVRKPNIYLYPPEPCSVGVTINPKGTITKSIPEYNNGWHVHVSPDGTIDDSLKYLFYEANLNIDFPDEGWCIAINRTWPFLKNTLNQYGLNDDEIRDFLTYWSSELPISKYYCIYPLINKQIDKYCPIEINPTPDGMLRLWFIFVPQESETKLKEPEIANFYRKGFTAIEWGGIVIDNR